MTLFNFTTLGELRIRFFYICTDTTNTLLSDNKHLLRPSEPVDRKYDNIIMFAAIVAASGVILLAIVVSSILFACKHRRRPPEPQEIKKSMR